MPTPFPHLPRGAALATGGAAMIVVFLTLAFALHPMEAAFTAYLAVVMAAISVSDFRRFIVPDLLSLPSIPIGILANSFVMHGAWVQGVEESLLGIVAGGGTFYLIRIGFDWLRGAEGLGLGDVKLAAVAGAWLGPSLLPQACLAATIAALASMLLIQLISGGVLSSRLKIPFGSFIAPVIFIGWAYRLWEAGAFVS